MVSCLHNRDFIWKCPQDDQGTPPALGAPWFCRILGQCRGEPGGFELENVAISRLQQGSAAWLRSVKSSSVVNLFTKGRWGGFSLKLVQLEKMLGRKEWEELRWAGSISARVAGKSA